MKGRSVYEGVSYFLTCQSCKGDEFHGNTPHEIAAVCPRLLDLAGRNIGDANITWRRSIAVVPLADKTAQRGPRGSSGAEQALPRTNAHTDGGCGSAGESIIAFK